MEKAVDQILSIKAGICHVNKRPPASATLKWKAAHPRRTPGMLFSTYVSWASYSLLPIFSLIFLLASELDLPSSLSGCLYAVHTNHSLPWSTLNFSRLLILCRSTTLSMHMTLPAASCESSLLATLWLWQVSERQNLKGFKRKILFGS